MTQQEAIDKFKANHRLDTVAVDSYPHVIESSIMIDFTDEGEPFVAYTVDNGKSTKQNGWMYTREA